MANIFLKIFDFFQRRTGLLIGLMAILSIGAALGILQLKLEEDISKIMPADEGVSVLNEVFENTELTDRLVFLISNKDSNVHTADPLIQFTDNFVERAKSSIDSVLYEKITFRVDQNAFVNIYDEFYNNLPIFLEEGDYKQMERRLAQDSIKAFVEGIYKSLLTPGSSFVKKFAFRDPFGYTSYPLNRLQTFQLDENFSLTDGYITTKDNSHLIFFIQPASSSKETKNNAALIRQLNETLGTTSKAHPEVDASYFGGVAVAVANARQIRRDVTKTVSIALLALLGLIVYFFRRISVFFYLIIPTIFGGLFALGLMTIFRSELSIIAIGIGSVLLGITLDYSLHVFTHHRSYGSARRGISDLTASILVSSCTTAAAFLCLYIIRSEALRDLGIFAALSVVISAILSLIILPLLLRNKSYQIRQTFIDKIAKIEFNKPGLIFFSILLITGMALFFDNVQFEDDLNEMNYMSPPLLSAESKLNDVTSVSKRGVYLITRGDDLNDAVNNSGIVQTKLDSLEAQGAISGFTNVNAILPTPALQQERLDRWRTFWNSSRIRQVESDISKAATALGFKPNTFDEFNKLISTDYSLVNLSDLQTINDVVFGEFITEEADQTTIMSIVRVEPSQTEGVYANFSNESNVFILDKTYLINRFIDILKNDFNTLVLISLFLVFLILHLNYGRIEQAFITFIPIVVSWIWTLAFMALLNIKFNIVNVIITTFIFGLGIDYSIFIMSGLISRYQYNVDHLKTYKTSILLSVFTTLIGIGVMIFAKHPALRSIASISIIGIVSVVSVAFLLQPILFRWLVRDRDGEHRNFPLTIEHIFRSMLFYACLLIFLVVSACLFLIVSMAFFLPETTRTHAKQMIFSKFNTFLFFILRWPLNRINISPEHLPNGLSTTNQIHSPLTPLLLSSIYPKAYFINYSNRGNWLIHIWTSTFMIKLNEFTDTKAEFQVINLGDDKSANLDEKNISFESHTEIIIEGLEASHSRSLIWLRGHDISVKNNKNIDELSTNTINVSSTDPVFYKHQLFDNYHYKGAVLFYYMLVKVRLEKYYDVFEKLIPKSGHILDVGCGYGFMTYMLLLLSPKRTLTGIDYDEQKIATANNCPAKNDRIHFIAGDVRKLKFPSADTIIVADMLHYLTHTDQTIVLSQLLKSLNANGQIIIRDGDADQTHKHKNTRLTEYFSTGLGFNKSENELHFLSGTMLTDWANNNDLSIKIVEQSEKTSNTIFLIRRK